MGAQHRTSSGGDGSHTEKRKLFTDEPNYSSPTKMKKLDTGESTKTDFRHHHLSYKILKYSAIPRLIIVIAWIAVLAYATYEMFLAAEEHLQWQKDPTMNPSPLSYLLGRGRDATDYEWSIFSRLLCTKLVFWYGAYIIISQFLQVKYPQALPSASALICVVFLATLIGIVPTSCFIALPVVYWILLRLRSKAVIWIASLTFVWVVEGDWCKVFVPVQQGLPHYYFAIASAWHVARCISYCFDTWDRTKPKNSSVSSLITFLQYTLYFPLTINGPLILFDKYDKHILARCTVPKPRKTLVEDCLALGFKLCRILFWMVVIEIILHYLYFRPLALTVPLLYEINWWAVGGVVYWLGQFFQMKYIVMYGIPSAMVEVEGLPAPPLPRCIAHIHRYSVLWKDFDRGLYHFLVRYTYVPTMELVDKLDQRNLVNNELRKCLASLASFIYVYIWHNASYEVFIWALFNFIGITTERIGSFIKRKIDASYRVLPVVWDVFVEPVCTVPLAIMSVMNSAVFCGTLATAEAVFHRFFDEFSTHHVPFFMLFFTNVGVIVRTWPTLRNSLESVVGVKQKV